jgi:DNA-binding transcriptional ArsR family regulator
MHKYAYAFFCIQNAHGFDIIVAETNYTELSERIKLLAHPERLRILDELRRDSECVCHLEALLGKPQPYVSQQLRILRTAGVIVDEKQAQNVFYRLADAQVAEWLKVILGPIVESGQSTHRRVSSCSCPKCASAVIKFVDYEEVEGSH